MWTSLGSLSSPPSLGNRRNSSANTPVSPYCLNLGLCRTSESPTTGEARVWAGDVTAWWLRGQVTPWGKGHMGRRCVAWWPHGWVSMWVGEPFELLTAGRVTMWVADPVSGWPRGWVMVWGGNHVDRWPHDLQVSDPMGGWPRGLVATGRDHHIRQWPRGWVTDHVSRWPHGLVCHMSPWVSDCTCRRVTPQLAPWTAADLLSQAGCSWPASTSWRTCTFSSSTRPGPWLHYVRAWVRI